MALFNLFNAIIATGGGLTIYGIVLAIYRLFFHPLVKFPGPKLAAATGWYEFYYEIIQPGSWLWEIQRLHEVYGPIVRINANELHILDPEYYDTIYGSTTVKRDKYGPFVVLANAPTSSFATVSHEHHRLRRKDINHLFSKQAISKFEPVINGKIDTLATRFREAFRTKAVVRLDAAYNALTMDVICQYGFAQDDNYLMEPDFKLAWRNTLKGASRASGLIRQFPFMLILVRVLPLSVVAVVQPRLVVMLEWQIAARKRIELVLKQAEPTSVAEKTKPKSLFEAMRDSELPPHEKTLDRFCDEAQTWIAAGTETVAKVLYTITCHLISNKNQLDALKKVLKESMQTPTTHLPISTLEQIPYLFQIQPPECRIWSMRSVGLRKLIAQAAVISEGLRVSNGLTTRLPRLARADEPMVYQDWVIPFGTPVSSTAYFSLQNPNIFPEPEKFRPERWILPNGEFNRALSKYLVNFGRGTRQCLGMNLAYGELYLTVSSIFRRFEMELFETTTEDVKTVHDFFVAAPGLQSKGVSVIITGEAKD